MNNKIRYKAEFGVKNWWDLVFHTIFKPRKLLDKQFLARVKGLQDQKNLLHKEFEEKMNFIAYSNERVQVMQPIGLNQSFYTFCTLAEPNLYLESSLPSDTIDFKETTLRRDDLKIVSNFHSVPLEYLKNEMSNELAKELIKRGIIEFEFQRNRVIANIKILK